MNNRQAWNIIVIFLLLIFLFTGATLVAPKRNFSETENRTLAQMPDITAEAVLSGSFESDYETYLTDQFVMRDSWIGLRTLAERVLLRQEVHDVYFGKDNYYIEKHTGTFDSQQAQMNKNFLSVYMNALAQRYDASHLTVMLVPNAVSVLRDKLPALAAPYDENAYLREVRDLLPADVWFDAGEVLAQHGDEEIFYRTDHHWKTLGAYYVFREWAAFAGLIPEASRTVPSYTADPGEGSSVAIFDAGSSYALGRIDDHTIRTLTEDFQGTVASRIGLTGISDSIQVFVPDVQAEYVLTYNRSDDVRSTYLQEFELEDKDKYAVFFGGNYPLIQARTGAGTGRRILVIKDSYANCFVPFLFRYFDEVDMVDLRYYYQSLSELVEEGAYTDILFLENAAGFAEDTSLSRLNM